MRAVVMLALLCGCGFEIRTSDGDAGVDAATDSSVDAKPDAFVQLPACMISPSYANGPEAGHRYRKLEGRDRDSAFDACSADGAHLVVIDTAAEGMHVRSLAGSDNVWIGLDDLETEGTFRWVTGKALGYEHFEGLEPNDSGVEDCTMQNTDETWNDTNCGDTVAAVCECEASYKPRPTPACRAMATSTVHDGRKYFIHEGLNSGKSWIDAKSDCEIIGAHLSVFADDDEDDAVDKEFIGENWIGLSDIATEGDFKWVDGTSLGFTHWNVTSPHGASTVRNCVRVNATWEDMDCAAKKEYSCECEP